MAPELSNILHIETGERFIKKIIFYKLLSNPGMMTTCAAISEVHHLKNLFAFISIRDYGKALHLTFC